jgi:hypothetical protein
MQIGADGDYELFIIVKLIAVVVSCGWLSLLLALSVERAAPTSRGKFIA